MTDSAKLPKIVILGTGGTIVSSGDDPLMLTGYRIKGLNVETLLCAVPEPAVLRTHRSPSDRQYRLQFDDLQHLA